MAWDFATEPEFQNQLDWMDDFVREHVEKAPVALRLEQGLGALARHEARREEGRHVVGVALVGEQHRRHLHARSASEGGHAPRLAQDISVAHRRQAGRRHLQHHLGVLSRAVQHLSEVDEAHRPTLEGLDVAHLARRCPRLGGPRRPILPLLQIQLVHRPLPRGMILGTLEHHCRGERAPRTA